MTLTAGAGDDDGSPISSIDACVDAFAEPPADAGEPPGDAGENGPDAGHGAGLVPACDAREVPYDEALAHHEAAGCRAGHPHASAPFPLSWIALAGVLALAIRRNRRAG